MNAWNESRVILCALVSDKPASDVRSQWWLDKAFVALTEQGNAGDDNDLRVFEVSLPAAADCRLCSAVVWHKSELHRRLICGRPEPLVAFWLGAS